MIEAIDRADAYRRQQVIMDARAAVADEPELKKYLQALKRVGNAR